ncbi:hypothetical protein A5784_17635 [Mycobacterium sp. 852013-50091_SCH5140682]|uniref:hypothetical protein n=1 Tax=Mycobacterium sp. 852013-50091_SCH5140682 TaxID=1834109 RepID=UPI0007EB8C99|nr:hypothetical protein [Mycobacterium sp. 852013-50091_SCH5140682]OBC01912.1 hypothetical protein A5784_17635 [Mycobacterium sp. 852013-50091_SCH5140682]
MTAPAADLRAAERWFLDRGLPSVLTARGRLRAVWPRSAPALAGLAVISTCSAIIYLLTGTTTLDVDEVDITPVQWVALTVVTLAVPLVAAVGWLVARMTTDRSQSVASATSLVIALVCSVIERDWASLGVTVCIVAAVLALTASGIGSVLGWAARLTMTQIAGIGELMVGSLPVVLLTVLVFFNTHVWLMAATITPLRMWLAVGLLVMIAVAFVVSRLVERAKPILQSASASARHADRLKGTPFDQMADPGEPYPLTRGERFNEIFVLAATQIAQVLMVAAVTSGIFFVLGLIVLSPEVADKWTRGGSGSANILGLVLPVPQALAYTTLFLGSLTFMYVSARAVTDAEYRATFFDPLIDDLKLTMVARNRYRYNTPA